MLVRSSSWLLLLPALLLGGAACSPFNANREINDAQGALAAARDAGAPRFAIYEYTSATEYLHKAREENSYSDYDAARTYAAHARELAQEARSRADRQRGALPAENAHEVDPQPAPEPGVVPAALADEPPQDPVDEESKKNKGRRK